MTKLTYVELKLFLRDPLSVFFTLALPVIMLVVSGNSRDDLNMTGPMLITLVLGILGFTCLPVYLAEYREKGVLRRLAATPTRPVKLLVAHVTVNLLVGIVAAVLVLGIGRVAFGMKLPPVLFAAGFLLAAAAFFALGLLMAAVLRTGRAANMVGLAVFLPMIAVSGVMRPREQLPAELREIGDFTPLSPAIRILRDAWTGAPLQPALLVILAAITVVAGGLAARMFRWE